MARTGPIRNFHHLEIRGSPREMGWRHGNSLRGEIHQVLDYYRRLFGLGDKELLHRTRQFRDIITAFSPHFAEEIEAIAAGAGLDPGFVFALNSRSELFNNLSVSECTAVINTQERVMAQNWDWAEAVEPLVVDLVIERSDGHRMRMLTEPGIIGKIGMNNAGIGVCLNILSCGQALDGLPVHVLLRAILECRSLQEVEELLAANSLGKASHVLVGDRDGGCISMEFAGSSWWRLRPESGVLVHTNHYLKGQSRNAGEFFPSTLERLARARSLLAKNRSRQGIRTMLMDRSDGELSICRPYSPSGIPGFGAVGTIFTVLMDLSCGEMEIRASSKDGEGFTRVPV